MRDILCQIWDVSSKFPVRLVWVIKVPRLDILRVGLLSILLMRLCWLPSYIGGVHSVSHVDCSCTQKACGFVHRCLLVLCRLRRSHLSSVELLTDLVSRIVDEHSACLPTGMSSTTLSSHLDVLLIEVSLLHLLLRLTSNNLRLVNALSNVLIILTLSWIEVFGVGSVILQAISTRAVWLVELITRHVVSRPLSLLNLDGIGIVRVHQGSNRLLGSGECILIVVLFLHVS